MSSDAVKFSPTLKLGKPLSISTAEEVHAAAAAAIKSLPAGRATLFFSESDDSSGAATTDEDPNPNTPGTSNKKSPVVVAESPPASPSPATDNPLAGILGYSDDESSGVGEDSPRFGADRKQEVPFAEQVNMQNARHHAADPREVQPPGASEAPRDVLDAELANFMSELESSGLLADQEVMDTQTAKDAREPQVAAAATHTAASPTGSGIGAPEEVSAGNATPATEAAAATDSESAEQRTLGRLANDPDWCKVLDTGSGKVYYWNVHTNEVLWEPPAGLDGDALVPFDEGTVAAVDAATPEEANAVGGDIINPSEASTSSPAASMQPASGSPLQQGTVRPSAGVPGPATSAAALTSGDQQQPPMADIGASNQASQQTSASHQDVQAVFLTLLQELRGPAKAKQLLLELPEAVRLTLQLELLHQQWESFAAQQAATAAGDQQPATEFSWVTYELYIMHKLQQAVQRLQPAVKELEQYSNSQQQQQPHTATAGGNATGSKPAADGAAPSAGEQSAVQTAPDAEEGEIEASDEDVDMEVDTDETQQQQPTSTKITPVTDAGKSDTAGQQGEKPAKAGYTEAGTYTSTAHMPAWAQPTYHYDFHSGYGGYYDPHTYQLYEASYAQQFDPTYAPQYMYGSHSAAGVNTSNTPAAAVAAAADVPPLPAEAPPPLPAEPLPQPDQHSQPPLPCDDLGQEAPSSAAAAAAATTVTTKRKQYVAQPVRNPAATAVITHNDWQSEGLFASAPVSGSLPSVMVSGSVDDQSSTPPLPSAMAAVPEVRKRTCDHDSKGAVTGFSAAKPAKAAKMSALFNKWATVKQQQEEEEAERQRRAELAADPVYQEQKRMQQLEKWRLEQLQSGAAEDNPNFTPLATDWRAKLGLQEPAAADVNDPAAKAARKAAKKAAKAAAKKGTEAAGLEAAASSVVQWPTNSKTKPDLGALSVGLPSGWTAMWDKASGDIYYGNPTTKVGHVVNCSSGAGCNLTATGSPASSRSMI